MKLKTRILWLCAATLLGLVALSAVALTTLYQSMMKERTAQLSNLVVLAHAAAQKAHDKEKAEPSRVRMRSRKQPAPLAALWTRTTWRWRFTLC